MEKEGGERMARKGAQEAGTTYAVALRKGGSVRQTFLTLSVNLWISLLSGVLVNYIIVDCACRATRMSIFCIFLLTTAECFVT